MELNIEEIYKWIDGYTISRQKRNIARDFSDAVPLAEILKHHFPKAVDLHNYSPKNATAQKIVNWNILNKKVLTKLNINLPSQTIDELAKSTPGAIEKVLFEIKTKLEKKGKKDRENAGDVYLVEGLSPQGSAVVPIKVKTGSKILDQKIVPSEVYDTMKKGIEEKDNEINTLKTKVTHLESLVKIKDERINDLTEQIKRLSSQQYYSSSASRLLNKVSLN
ncbi:CH-like domain in sperm protein [Popillia japonica]|uniref:CH-like domain in sperm protein n=1 Tax=Popillia japonica TaxID=7064 RepID=A0AAW1MC03_POPJA